MSASVPGVRLVLLNCSGFGALCSCGKRDRTYVLRTCERLICEIVICFKKIFTKKVVRETRVKMSMQELWKKFENVPLARVLSFGNLENHFNHVSQNYRILIKFKFTPRAKK